MAYQIKKDPISKIPKVQLAFWLLVRLAMLICAGYSFIHGDTVMGFESIFCFIFTHLWDLFQIFGNGSFIEEVPPLSQTLLNIIIFIGIVFGSYLGLFDKLAHFDDFMHLLSGFVCAAFGFDFARIIQRKKGPCAVTLAAIFGLMFAVTIAAGWEFYEFLMDTLHGTNLQLAKAGPETAMFDLAKYHGEYGYIGLVDTMTDMMMNVVGGIVGMIFMIVHGDTKETKSPPPGKNNVNREPHAHALLVLFVFILCLLRILSGVQVLEHLLQLRRLVRHAGLPWAVQPVRRYG